MKVSSGQVFTRLDTIKQSILLFMHAKLSINSDHRFAFCALENPLTGFTFRAIGKSTFWLQKEFSSTLESALAAFRGITEHSSSDQADLTQLFRAAAHEAKKSRAQNRILRLVLLYCRSSVAPHHQWPVTQKLFTLDVIYLHDKPGPENCPQKVYDALVDALEQVSEYEGYIFESGQGLPRTLFRHMCVLLSHPQQRCVQDDIDIPKSLTKKPSSVETTTGGEIVPVSSQ
ncbi:BRISC and BRCA1-A complex member 1 [Heracleum sosnowskyi]|uniref:BRISC and BRCA1-A complex member 1 n=1 Tax=Heracleum sosnowskyi TaxID=360622 RepID=A0AAD8HKC6_9APIA|nr:BRISC and BRCA1-A complex member 1 [Heracleum sosnowskyi]